MEDLLNSLTADLNRTKFDEGILNSLSSLLIETAPVMILMLSPQGRILHFNRFMEKVTDYSLKEVFGADWFETFIPETQREETKKLFISAIDDINTYANQDYILTKDGTKKTVEWYDRTVKDENGNTIGLLCIGLDVTERVKAQESLKKREQQFRLLVESTNDWTWEVNLDGIYTYVSPQASTLLGYEPKEIVGKSPFEFMSSDEAERIGNLFQEIVHNKANIVALKNECICKDGSIKILETSGTPFFDENGVLLGYRGIDRDITEREYAQQSLRESEEKFRTIMTSAQDAIVMMDHEGKITLWNEAAQDIFGYSQEEAIGKILHTLIAPKRFLEAHNKGFAHFQQTGEGPAVGKTLELSALKKDGVEFPIELSLSKTVIKNKFHAIGIIRDISERKKMQEDIKLKDEMMIAQSKQAAMSDMIAMLAHQWRQPISVISMAVNNLQVSIELEEEITPELLNEHIETLHEQVSELDKTISNFRDFFKPQEEGEEKTTLKEVLTSVMNIIGKSLENNDITLNINSKDDTCFLLNKSSLVQVLLNILGNAKHVLVDNKIDNPIINLNVSSTNDSVVISVCDNGGGIPDSVIDKIAQPYFTTQNEFNGKGLGLYISRTIVEKHLFGTLTWHNEQDGACFVITLQNKQAVK